MKRVQRGFTIIEVMLFLAVSGVLAASVLATVGSTIGMQRYRDATHSFMSYLQGQYNQAINVRNDMDVHNACTGAGFSSSEMVQAGTSADCVIIGRLITSADGQRFQSAPIYMSGVNNEFLQSSVGDDVVFTASGARQIFIRTDGGESGTAENYTLDWGVQTAVPASGANAWSIAIVRSPVSGVIHTYTSRANTQSLGQLHSLVQDANRQSETAICLDPSGWLVGQALGVVIAADAPGASSVTTRTEGC